MNLSEPQEYNLKIGNDFSYELSQSGKLCKFSRPATVRGIAKLYTVTMGKTLIYVGIAKQPMSSRLNYGFKSNGKAGYHGYKWKNIREDLKLNVWVAKSGNEYVSLSDIEVIEAEVAYLCRHLSGQWPTYQHEIHFHQSKHIHRKLAQAIYENATN